MANQLTLNSTSLEELKAKAAALPEFVDTTNATATASDILSGKTAYVNGSKVTGNIATKTASNLSASGATVTVPAGYYASQATKAVTTASQATPSVSIDANGKITASATQTAGYVSAGTKTGTLQMTTKAATTITPTKSSQTAVDQNVYTTGAVTVAPIPDQYADVSGVTPLPSEVLAGEIYVDSQGVEREGTFRTDAVFIIDEDGIGQVVPADYTNIDTGYMRVPGSNLGNAMSYHVLEGQTFTGCNGYYINALGTMPNNGDTSKTIDGLEVKSVTIPDGYTSGGTIALDDTIDNVTDEYTSLLNQLETAIDECDEMNFRIVGGTTQPEEPVENTIWVNTSTTIAKWNFGGASVSSPVEGMVFIPTYQETASAFSLFKDNEAWFYPGVVSQYESGSWVNKSAQIYQNGAWKALVVKSTLYSNGDQCTTLTGGWETAGNYNAASAWSSTSEWSSYSTIASNYLSVSARSGSSNNYGGIIGTTNQVQISGYKTLRVKGNISGYNSTTTFYIGVNTSKTISQSPTAYISLTTTGSFDRSLSLPSNVTSAYVFILAAVNGGDSSTWTNTMSVTEITLE